MTDIKKYNKLAILLIVSCMIIFGIKDIYLYTSCASYIASIFNCLFALLVYGIIYKRDTVNEFVNSGTKIIKVISILTIMILFIFSASFFAYVCELIQQFFMKKSPVYYLCLFLILPCAIGSVYGFKTLSGYAILIWIFMLICISTLLLFSYESFNIGNLFPVFGNDANVLLYKSFDFSIYGVILIYYFLLCDCKIKSKYITKNILSIIVSSGIISILICLALNLILPYNVVTYSDNAILTIASSIKLNFLFERSEIIVLLLWVSLSFITVGTFIACIYFLTEKFIGISDKKGINFCCILFVYLLALIINKYQMTHICIQISKYGIFFMSLLVPFFAFIRKAANNV